jgi:hypothetical protein
MAKRLPDPIPSYLREAFSEAVELFSNWSPAAPEREVSIHERRFTISEVCGLVDGYADLIPDSVVVALTFNMQTPHTALREKLARVPTYSTGAKCLRRLISDRKADYRRLANPP